MKVLLSWLRELTPVEGDPEWLGEQLSQLGLAVEEMVRVGEGLDGIAVARVLETRAHPKADRVQLVDVDTGDGEPLQIVCGAFNFSAGDLVPLATLGSVMPDGMEIARRKMRGEWSNGMLCSPTELGLGEDHGGIMILPPSLTVGAPLVDELGLEPDIVYDLEINANRPDAMSIVGVARDLAARLGLPFTLPEPSVAVGPGPPSGRIEDVTVDVLDPDLCGRFTARVLRGIQVTESDPAVARRLALLGMRPINSVVDASNYVMLEMGQPNHPYDLAKLAGPGFRVRRARPGETITTLDEVERSLTDDDLLICDADDRPVGIAGVMGGADTDIDGTTTDAVVEMAWFQPMAIARTSRRLKLRSEASARFEKGTDPEIIDLAQLRLAELLGAGHPDDGGARLEAGTVDRRGELPPREPVRVRTARVNRLLGSDIGAGEMVDLLDGIGFTADSDVAADAETFAVTVPSWRYDSATEIDIVEEVARMYGYDRLGRSVPRSPHTGALTGRQQERRMLRRLLAGLGLSEALPLPFLAPGALTRVGLPDDGIHLTNPLVAEESVLRTSLLPGLLGALSTNAARRNVGVGLWEIGHVARPAVDPDAELPDEREHLAAALGGRDAAAAVQAWWAVAEGLALDGVRIVNDELPGLHPTRSARLVGPHGESVGSVGEIDPSVLEDHGIQERVGWLQVDLDVVAAIPHGQTTYRPVSRYPSSDIDLAFSVDDAVPATDVEATLRDAAGDMLAWVKLFDVYRGTGIPAGRRSLAYTLRLEARDRTLTDADVAEVRQRCIDAVQARFDATLRG